LHTSTEAAAPMACAFISAAAMLFFGLAGLVPTLSSSPVVLDTYTMVPGALASTVPSSDVPPSPGVPPSPKPPSGRVPSPPSAAPSMEGSASLSGPPSLLPDAAAVNALPHARGRVRTNAARPPAKGKIKRSIVPVYRALSGPRRYACVFKPSKGERA
jgi:hypothetical protein